MNRQETVDHLNVLLQEGLDKIRRPGTLGPADMGCGTKPEDVLWDVAMQAVIDGLDPRGIGIDTTDWFGRQETIIVDDEYVV